MKTAKGETATAGILAAGPTPGQPLIGGLLWRGYLYYGGPGGGIIAAGPTPPRPLVGSVLWHPYLYHGAPAGHRF